MIYNILKSVHIFSVIAWMAGLLYLPRIFMYHADTNITKETSETFKVMERKLYFYIMTPAMSLSWLFGLLLIHSVGFEQLGETWMVLKIVFVLLLTLYHFYLGKILNQFNINQNKRSHKFYRYINEIPTILLILIVFVVIFKPL